MTDRRHCQGDFLERIEQIARGTAYQAILLREKDLTEQQYKELAEKVLAVAAEYKKKCILHTCVGAAEYFLHPYLHLPLPVWEKMPADRRRNLRSHISELGTSVHSPEQLQRAVSLGADYVIAGHIFETDCKKGKKPRGLSFLRMICLQSPVPVYAIGGITPEREEDVIRQGAAGVCSMSGAMGSLQLPD